MTREKKQVMIIGAGLSGLTAALASQKAGAAVTMITMGMGGLQLSQGSIDVLGYRPERVTHPLRELAEYGKDHPQHPYAKLSAAQIEAGKELLTAAAGESFFSARPEGENWLLPTVVGAARPTLWAPASFTAAQLEDGKELAIVGLRQHKDFYPELIAGNLNRTELPGGGRVKATAYWLDFPARDGEGDSSALTYARALDQAETLNRFARALDQLVPAGSVVCLPAILGIKDRQVPQKLSQQLNREVAEIPGLPPSVPGMRLNETLLQAVQQAGIRLIRGAQVVGYEAEAGQITALRTHAAGRDVTYQADAVIYAGGGFESGALEITSYGEARETIFELPLVKPEGSLVHGDYWGDPQPLFEVGVRTDQTMRPCTETGQTVFSNLYVTGGLLPGATRWEEKSGEGIALASAMAACQHLFETAPNATDQGQR